LLQATYAVGTFQYIAAKQNIEDLNTLVDYTIERHYPQIKSSKTKALDLLNLVMEKAMSVSS
jgi:uncharacterized protein YdiU (UPF0061 family)